MTDNPFILVKSDGRKIEFRGLLTEMTLTTFNHNLLVEGGDTVERTLPNGTLERFQVMDTVFHPGLGIEAGQPDLRDFSCVDNAV